MWQNSSFNFKIIMSSFQSLFKNSPFRVRATKGQSDLGEEKKMMVKSCIRNFQKLLKILRLECAHEYWLFMVGRSSSGARTIGSNKIHDLQVLSSGAFIVYCTLMSQLPNDWSMTTWMWYSLSYSTKKTRKFVPVVPKWNHCFASRILCLLSVLLV